MKTKQKKPENCTHEFQYDSCACFFGGGGGGGEREVLREAEGFPGLDEGLLPFPLPQLLKMHPPHSLETPTSSVRLETQVIKSRPGPLEEVGVLANQYNYCICM